MVAFIIFSWICVGTIGTLLQVRKSTESNICALEANAAALSIIEQVQLMSYDDLSTTTSPPPAPLQFVGIGSGNTVQIQGLDLAWATDATTFTPVGEVQGGVVKGLLLDVDYRNASAVTVRQKRYLNFSVNLQKQVDNVSGNVGIILTYKWQIPDRKTSTGAPMYMSRQIRSARCPVESY